MEDNRVAEGFGSFLYFIPTAREGTNSPWRRKTILLPWWLDAVGRDPLRLCSRYAPSVLLQSDVEESSVL